MKTVLKIAISGQRIQHLQHVPDGWETITNYMIRKYIYLKLSMSIYPVTDTKNTYLTGVL